MIGTPNSTTARGYVVHSDEAPAFWQIGNLWRVMATGVQTGNSFCLIDQLVMANGGGPCTHSHTQDEGLYVVSGHCTFYAWGLTISAGPGEFVAVPRYGEHAFTVDAPDTQLINFYLPAGFEILLMGLAHPAERNELPPDGVPMAPRKLVERLSGDYGQIPILGLPFADPPRADNMVTKPTPNATVSAFNTNAGTAPSYWLAGGRWTVLADGAATDGSYCLFEETMPKGPAAPPTFTETWTRCSTCLTARRNFLSAIDGRSRARAHWCSFRAARCTPSVWSATKHISSTSTRRRVSIVL
jgi:quercetin dioxygenase-like cupin family protein